MNALAMEFEDDTFDLVWACESGEHMPDKRLYVEEMTRVLKPGALLSRPCLCMPAPNECASMSTTRACLVHSCLCSLMLSGPYQLQFCRYASLLWCRPQLLQNCITSILRAPCPCRQPMVALVTAPCAAFAFAQNRASVWLRAGGSLVIATWCQREEAPGAPFSGADRAALQFLYDEWAHPYFVSVQEYGRLLQVRAQSRWWQAHGKERNAVCVAQRPILPVGPLAMLGMRTAGHATSAFMHVQPCIWVWP